MLSWKECSVRTEYIYRITTEKEEDYLISDINIHRARLILGQGWEMLLVLEWNIDCTYRLLSVLVSKKGVFKFPLGEKKNGRNLSCSAFGSDPSPSSFPRLPPVRRRPSAHNITVS